MCAVKTAGLATGKREIYYPESDGKPMAETDLHWDETAELKLRLKDRYAADPDVYVASDLLIYYEEGNPRAAVAPDVFVVFGVPMRQRRIYKLWEEGVAPAVAIEVTSRKTRREDLREKMEKYALLGIGEYFLFDPEAEYLRPPLQGHRLVAGTWRPMQPEASGGLLSQALGLELRLEGGLLELYDLDSGRRLPRMVDKDAAAEWDRQRADMEQARAEVEREHAAAERRRAELERARAEAAEVELERLRAELDRRGNDAGEDSHK